MNSPNIREKIDKEGDSKEIKIIARPAESRAWQSPNYPTLVNGALVVRREDKNC